MVQRAGLINPGKTDAPISKDDLTSSSRTNIDLGGRKLDALVVNSLSEQETAVLQGWSVELSDAIARVQSAERRDEHIQAVRRWYERWEWALKAMAVLFALAAGAIALLKVL